MEEFERKLQRRMAQSSITNSALRNQGDEGLLELCRTYCQTLDLAICFERLLQSGQWNQYLDDCTGQLQREANGLFKRGIIDETHLGWGTTRKALNLFFAAVVSNHYFASKFHLPIHFTDYREAVKHLEVALDSHVAKGMQNDGIAEGLEWPGVKHLTPDLSRRYQLAAAQHADRLKLAPIHLDVLYWRSEKPEQPVL